MTMSIGLDWAFFKTSTVNFASVCPLYGFTMDTGDVMGMYMETEVCKRVGKPWLYQTMQVGIENEESSDPKSCCVCSVIVPL